MDNLGPGHPLVRMLTGMTEHAFLNLGVADPPLVDYVSGLLIRFVRTDAIHRLPAAGGQPIARVIEMVSEAEGLPEGGATKREFLRHIGDVTLFWTGLYPESLERDPEGWGRHAVINYTAFGKRSYLLASHYERGPFECEAPVLRRLSSEFELCALGLREVRRDWEQMAGDPPGDFHLIQ